jgi:hypothetical protein
VRLYSIFLLALSCLPSWQSAIVLASGEDYWNKSNGGFSQEHTATNYQRSSYFLQGGDYWSDDDPTSNRTIYPELFTQPGMKTHVYDPLVPAGRSNHLYPIPDTPTELAEWVAADPTNGDRYRVGPNGKIEVKMSTFYLSNGTFDNGTAGWNDQYDLHRSHELQSLARNYQKTAGQGVSALIWLTPYGQLKEYMTNPDPSKGPAHGQWSDEFEILKEFEIGADGKTKNFTSGKNPYNRAAAALGMINGTFQNPDNPTGSNNLLGFGNFYRVADLWFNAEDVARTSVQSSWKENTIVAPAGFDEQEHRPLLRAMVPDSQVENFGYWGPKATKDESGQEAWHDDMRYSYQLTNAGDDKFEWTASIRSGALQLRAILEADDITPWLDSSERERFNQWRESHENGVLTFDRKLWSSNNNYHHFQSAFYPLWWQMNTQTGVFPWTGHGYTYDWYYGHSNEQYYDLSGSTSMMTNSFSEFIVRPGAEFEVEKTEELVHYLTGTHASYQPTAIPEPATSLLAIVAFVLWHGRWHASAGSLALKRRPALLSF